MRYSDSKSQAEKRAKNKAMYFKPKKESQKNIKQATAQSIADKKKRSEQQRQQAKYSGIDAEFRRLARSF